MLLAEALIEKDYIDKSISSLYNTIKDLSIVYDKSDVKFNKDQLKSKFEDLEKLYTKYQQFNIVISRAESVTIIMNETEISLRDAILIRDIMHKKLNRLINVSYEVARESADSIVCIDKEGLENMMEMLRLDIKTLDVKIQNKLWTTKVK